MLTKRQNLLETIKGGKHYYIPSLIMGGLGQ
ncbi:MAG: hypothetical protein PWR12_1874 [Eubacteriaceae bacterium]|jgi:hypothetical protein|nr:hypothetical protein [Eubacteriaceae bacterium]MDK2905798.1 hypothetical protein [Eubacteriaceae bacterium]MDK2961388.1 hypothetical protein [Eubacteriaceae bacterium]